MKRSSKQTKNSLKKRRIAKNIKLYSYRLSDEEFKQIESMFERFGKVENWFYQRYSGINHMLDINHWQSLRNQIRLEQKKYDYSLTDMFGIQGKHWVMALFNVCSMLKSIWSNLANRIKKQVQAADFSKDEQHYLNFVLSIPQYWYAILNMMNWQCLSLSRIRRSIKDFKK